MEKRGGFYKIAAYYENPHQETLFLELDLTKTIL